MKQRGQLIIQEFKDHLEIAGKSGLELDPEDMQGRRGRQHARKRDLLFKKLKLDPRNEYHIAYVCAIIYDYLYVDKPSAAVTNYDDNDDYELIIRFINFRKKRSPEHRIKAYKAFIEHDNQVNGTYGPDGINAFRMRLKRAADNAISGTMKLTKKRADRLPGIIADIEKYVKSKSLLLNT